MMMVMLRNKHNPALARAMARHISSGRSARIALELQYQKGYPDNLEFTQSHLLINIRRHEVTLKFREFLPERMNHQGVHSPGAASFTEHMPGET